MTLIRMFVQTVVFAIAQMWSNKVRAILTTLGIIIGVWAITAVIAVVGGLNGFVLDEFEKFGATKMFIWGDRPDELRDKVSWSDVKLKPREARELREHATTLERLTMVASERVSIRYADKLLPGVRVTGIEPDWHAIEQRFVVSGRPFSMTDDEEQLQVCVINDQAINELQLPRGGVGEYILINGRRFLVVGIVETKEMSAMFGGGESRTEVFVPYSTMYKLDDWLWTEIRAEMKSPELAEEAKQEIRFILRKARDLPPNWEDTFGMFQMTEAVERFNVIGMFLTLGAGVLVSISLVVGGVGIMNIMLVSVSERTREIGLRKAVGANPIVILLQFLVEAVILCMAGGVIGLIIGQASTLVVQRFLDNADIPPWAIVLAFVFCAGVGIGFGMWPAIKAARLDPIEALRHE